MGYGGGEEAVTGGHLVPLPDDDHPLVIDESRMRLEESDDDSNSHPPLLDSPQRTPDGTLKGRFAMSLVFSSSNVMAPITVVLVSFHNIYMKNWKITLKVQSNERLDGC